MGERADEQQGSAQGWTIQGHPICLKKQALLSTAAIGRPEAIAAEPIGFVAHAVILAADPLSLASGPPPKLFGPKSDRSGPLVRESVRTW
jgi:hypothetical protein